LQDVFAPAQLGRKSWRISKFKWPLFLERWM